MHRRAVLRFSWVAAFALVLSGCETIRARLGSSPDISSHTMLLCSTVSDTGYCPRPPDGSRAVQSPSDPDLFPRSTGNIHVTYLKYGAAVAPTVTLQIRRTVTSPQDAPWTRDVPVPWVESRWDGFTVLQGTIPPPEGGWRDGLYTVQFLNGGQPMAFMTKAFEVSASSPPHN